MARIGRLLVVSRHYRLSTSSYYVQLSYNVHQQSIRHITTSPIYFNTITIQSKDKKPNNNVDLAINKFDLIQFPPSRTRNFSIIAHIDHGKSTLADRLLELTGTIRNDRSRNKRVLDTLKVEQDRGITVKAQGHVDFSYEGIVKANKHLLIIEYVYEPDERSFAVSRSLSACEGALLLVDACQGIQAQTVANFYLAFGQGLQILPVLNKIDLPAAEPERVAKQIETVFELDTSLILQVSAKTGVNCEAVLSAVIERLSSPTGDSEKPLQVLLFDSWYDTYLGVVCLIRVINGTLRKGDRIISMHTEFKYDIIDAGILHPGQISTGTLYAGQVGYIITGMKSAKEARIGDTFYRPGAVVPALPGFQTAKSMVFSGIFPINAADFAKLDDSIEKLTLNDASVAVQKETSLALGQGFRLGFLGTLHMDVFRQRLEEEYEANIICTAPTVPFRVTYTDETIRYIRNPSEFPDPNEHAKVHRLEEPMILATIITPDTYIGQILDLCNEHRGEQTELTYIDEQRVLIKFRLPMGEIVTDFYDNLKSRSSGYASFDYEDAGYAAADLVKMNVLLNARPVDALASIHHRTKVETMGRNLVKKLKDVIEKQLYEVAIQTTCGSKVIARETYFYFTPFAILDT